MDEEEQNRYVVQLKEEFDSCDTTGTGYLDKEELTALCNKLHLEGHLPLLLGTLLGPHHYSRVNFEEFKEGFVAVLSRSLDLSTSEEETSYLEPVVPEEVKPKFVKGTKRYGRRSRPDGPDSELTGDSEETPPFRPDQAEPFPAGGVRRAKLRRSTSLESVESLKSDEETGSTKDGPHQTFEAQGQLKRWKRDSVETPRPSPVPRPNAPEAGGGQRQAGWEELSVGDDGFLTRPELSAVCQSLGLQDLGTEELDTLFKRLDKDKHGRVSVREVQKSLFKHGPVPTPTSSSTPIRLLPQRSLTQAFEDSSVRSTSPSILSPTVGQRLLTRLDDGSGFTSADRIITTWSDEGIRNSRDILQTLDFSLDEKVSLAELTLALDNELLVSGNGIHQAALISYKNEIQFLQVQSEQACRERNKVKVDLDRAERCNLQLVREVDDRHATMETLNESKIRGLEQEYRDRLTALRSESEQESEVLLQQVEWERAQLQEEVQTLQTQDTALREEISASNQENQRLERELAALKGKLSEAEGTVSKLQRDLDSLLLDRFGTLSGMNQEERFSEIIKEYELQCLELRDRNDELNSELEVLKSGSGRRSRRAWETWSNRRALTTESDSDDPEMKRGTSPMERKKLQVSDKNGLGSLENMSATVSIETELAVERLKEQHSQEVQDLKIQLETKVNFYERSLELMRRNIEVERKDISQGFKMEIAELEEQKARAEERAEGLRDSLAEARAQLQAGGPRGPEQERRAQRERAELEQNHAREMSSLVQRLTSERDQLEAELTLRLDREVQLVREEEEGRRGGMKAQHAEAQRDLLHQLHCERVRLQEQTERLRSVTMETERLRSVAMETEQLEARGAGLEAELQEEWARLEDCKLALQSQEALVQQLGSQLSAKEEELEEAGERERELREQLQALMKEKEAQLVSPGSLSTAGAQQEVLLRVKEEELELLRGTVEENQEVLRSRGEELLRLAAMVQYAEEDKAQLEEVLEERGREVERLRARVEGQAEELERARRAEEVLREALGQDEAEGARVRAALDAQQEESRRLGEENARHARLSERLSARITETEAKSSRLRDAVQDLRLQLGRRDKAELELRALLETQTRLAERLKRDAGEKAKLLERAEELSRDRSDRLEQLASQLSSAEEELSSLRGRGQDCDGQLRRALGDAQAEVRRVEGRFREEKSKMAEQLQQMERLVLALEAEMDQAGPQRGKLDDVTTENGALKDRLAMSQEDVQRLEEEVNKQRKKLDERDKEHEKGREEVERLFKENAKYREEVLELSSRNLQLSGENAELSARLRADQGAVQLLTERVAQLTREQEEGAAVARQQQEMTDRREREQLQLQSGWGRDKELLEVELNATKEKLQRLTDVEAELTSLTLKHDWLEKDKERLQREAEDRLQKMETLQEAVHSLSSQTEQLHSQLQTATLEKGLQAQELSANQRTLHEAKEKLKELEAAVDRLRREKEELSWAQQNQEGERVQALQGQCQSLRSQNQDLLRKVEVLQVQQAELQVVSQECQTLRTKQAQLETAVQEGQDQLLKANAGLTLAQSQHAREAEQLRERAGAGSREQLAHVHARLAEEQRRALQLEERLTAQSRQAATQMVLQQEQYEKSVNSMEEKMAEVESKLKNLRLVLQEKVNQLKEQLAKNAKSDMLLKDLYVENSQLMKALQVTEQRQKGAEKKNFLLEEKVVALNKLLRRIAPASLTT
ncbi:ninein-like protein [Conger conger]|uniref:ninein-like protein n=1 Tax=Conger conger TaxID=82655 RepID=UPI002A599AEC|nr:ninein-like protein [Conger conger]